MNRIRRNRYQQLLSSLSPTALAKLNSTLVHLPDENILVFKGLCQGWTQSELAAALGVSQPRISQILAQTLTAVGPYLR